MATPTLVQHVATSVDATYNVSPTAPTNYKNTTFTVYLPNSTLTGNTLILAFQWAGGGTITSVKDSAGNSLTSGPTFTNSSNNNLTAQVFYEFNIASGLTYVQVTFANSSTVNQPQGILSEWYNVTGVDTGVSSTSSTSLSPGSITTSAASDLVYYYAADISDNLLSGGLYGNGFRGTSITKGTNFTPLSMYRRRRGALHRAAPRAGPLHGARSL